MAYFNPCCCDKTVRSIFIIGIYDESSIYSASTTYSQYFFEQCGVWREYIQHNMWCGNASIRYGFIQPLNPSYIGSNEKIWDINGVNGALIDTDRANDPGWLTILPARRSGPRVFRNEIVDKFMSMLAWPQFPTERFARDCSGHENDPNPYKPRYCTYPEGPELLLFSIDNSGSITINNYQEELDAAKTELKNRFPKMQILSDYGSSDEDYLDDALNAATQWIYNYDNPRCGKCCKNCVCKNTMPDVCQENGGVWSGWSLQPPPPSYSFRDLQNVNYCKTTNGAAECGC